MKFLDKGMTLNYESEQRLFVPCDLAGLNAALVISFTAAIKPIKDLWDKLDRAKLARRRTHPTNCTPTTRVIMSFF